MESFYKKIIVALDHDDLSNIKHIVSTLKGKVGAFKIGKQAFTSLGPSVVHWIQDQGENVFLDLKFHDIPNTVAKACGAAAKMGVFMLNVHASGGAVMMSKAASLLDEIRMSGEPVPILLGVTVLTSLSSSELSEEISCKRSLEEQVIHLAQLAKKSGLQGVVASPLEIGLIRKACGSDFKIVTPGVRPSWFGKDDQKRTMTPKEACDLGADYVVIGRPITSAKDPLDAVERLFQER